MYKLSEGDLRGFFQTPFSIYGKELPWVSPMRSDLKKLLDPNRNPFYAGPGEGTTFVLRRNGELVGRISAQVHHDANRRFHTRGGYFGLFDVTNDQSAATRLLDAAEAWVAERGCTEISGNFSLTSVQEIGVVTSAHERSPYTAMHWSPPHLAERLTQSGYEPFFPMTTFELDLVGFDPDTLLGPKQQALEGCAGIRWTYLGRRSFAQRREDVRALLNESFSENPHFVPVSRAEFDFQTGPLEWIVDPRLSVLVDIEDRPAGVLVCIPDLNPFLRASRSRFGVRTPRHLFHHRGGRTGSGERRAVLVFSGVAHALQDRGLGGLMLHRVTHALKDAGYTHMGITWISSQNGPSMRFTEKLGAKPLHELALFRKSLEA